MSDHATTAFQQALLNLDEDDWVGRSVLNREAAMLGLEGYTAYADWTSLAMPKTSSPAISIPSTSLDIVNGPTESTIAVEAPQSDENPDASIRCSWPNCSHNSTFARGYELRRHVLTVHATSLWYRCRAAGCFKGAQSPTFKRVDKLTSHIRSCHTSDTMSECPAPGCTHELPLGLMGIHIRRTHPADAGESRGVANAASFGYVKCPVWSCGKSPSLETYQAHLIEHTIHELLMAWPSMHAQGFCISQNGLIVSQACLVTSVTSVDVSDIAVLISCPVCQAPCVDTESFKQHFWAMHLFKDCLGGCQHFLAWKKLIEPLTVVWALRRGIQTREPWHSFEHSFLKRVRVVSCPACDFRAIKTGDSTLEPDGQHHLSLLRPINEVIAELMPYRMQIVRLYPAFETHPIFDDFNPAPATPANVEELDDTTMADA